MSPPTRPPEAAAAVCVYHEDLMNLLRDVKQDQKDILASVNQLSTDLTTHIAIHKDRERTAFPWGKVLVTLASTFIAFVALLLLLQFAEHSKLLGDLLGPKVP